MPRYMLDTNMCIYLMKHQPEQVARRFAACYVGDVVMSAITYAELQHGVAISSLAERGRDALAHLIEAIPVAPFDAAAAASYAPIRYAARHRKRGQLDQLIAAHAAALKVVLVTNSERDFAAYPGLAVENWLTAKGD